MSLNEEAGSPTPAEDKSTGPTPPVQSRVKWVRATISKEQILGQEEGVSRK